MSVHAVSWALNQKLPATRKLVLICLADCAAEDLAFPALKRVAGAAGVTIRQAQRHLRSLEESGHIEFVRQRLRSNGSDSTREYRLLMSPPGDDVQMSPPSGGDIQVSPPERMNTQEKELAPPSRRAPSPRRRNLVWDVLVEHFDAPQGTSASKDFGSSVKEIREILSSNFSQPLDDPASEPYVRQQIGLRVEQMGEARYRTHRVLRRDWTRLGALAGLDGSGGIVRSASAPAVSWEDADVNPLGQLTECEICGEDEGNHHEQCPNA